MNGKSTLVIGASENTDRYSNMAIRLLRQYGHPVYAVGNKLGQVADVKIEKEKIEFKDIDTITLYLNPKNQESFYDYILAIHPKRVIFNPGTENSVLQNKLAEKKIAWEEACTLVLLRTNSF